MQLYSSPPQTSHPTPSECARFAPSRTGVAHPGTLLSGLLCWLDARTENTRVVLRLEDLDPARCRPVLADRMLEDLTWLGLHFDEVAVQSERSASHDEALDQLAAAGVLYPCSCSRSDLRRTGRRAPDGGFCYPNTCADRALPPGGWRECRQKGIPVRARLPDGVVRVKDRSGDDLSQAPREALGDPVVLRRDGAVAYNLAVVIDDHEMGITRVVRGRDIAPSTATQVALSSILKSPPPTYRHHFLLLEPRGDKLAKLHGSIGTDRLRAYYSSQQLCGFLAYAAGLTPTETPVAPDALIPSFEWARVQCDDRVVQWRNNRMHLSPVRSPERPSGQNSDEMPQGSSTIVREP